MPPRNNILTNFEDERDGSTRTRIVSSEQPTINSHIHPTLCENRGLANPSRSPPFSEPVRILHEYPSKSSASTIRYRFLNRLGISSKDSVQILPRLPESLHFDAREQVQSFQETLKADYGRPDNELSMKNSRSPVYSSRKKNGGVSFNSTVKVQPIPRRSAYSKRMRRALWLNPAEMQQNAARNSLEFAAEGWDWRKVVNDEDMIIYAGERVHPVHFVKEYAFAEDDDEITSNYSLNEER